MKSDNHFKLSSSLPRATCPHIIRDVPHALTIPVAKMLTIVLAMAVCSTTADILEDCSKLFNPQRYLNQLPSMGLPYVSNLAIPSNVASHIRPTQVVTTKVVSVFTKYVHKSPVCIRYSGEKPLCKAIGNGNANPYEHLITKGEYFLNGGLYGPHYGNIVTYNKRSEGAASDKQDFYIEPAEAETPREDRTRPTPNLDNQQLLRDILIDDRLGHLEEVLPYYSRRKTYETSTITVTKVLNSGEPMATLVVKNCIPQGIEICPKKNKKRKSKVGSHENGSSFKDQYYG